MTQPSPRTTTNAGIGVASDEHSLTQGDGGILLADHYLIEKMAQFNRERVPERVVHAKGAGAFGELVITEDISRFTKASVLQPGARTEMLARFSTVAGEKGSPDTWRDPRGFSLKFYTDEGNWDMVGNNTPVFFMKDPMKFQDFIRSQKRMPDSGLRDNNMQWDYWTQSPESAHQVTILMGDRGIPKTLRHMHGYGSHTYQLINEAGDRVWCKFVFHTDQGNDYLDQDEADRLAGASPDFHRQDLFGAIEKGDFPSWTMFLQVMPEADAATYKVNPFDVTKTWSHADYPLIEVGRFTLNRNPDNYHGQIESAAFEPSNLVPGIGLSPDKMLQGRLFSYPDAHRYRIGPNYMQLPVNQPKAPVHSYAKDGPMRYSWNAPEVPVYAPNTQGGPVADPSRSADEAGWTGGGPFVRAPYEQHPEDDDWSQPGTLVREVMDDAARERFVTNVSGHLLNGVREPVLSNAFAYWSNVDADIGKRIEAAVREQQPATDPTTGAGAAETGDLAART